MCTIVSDNSGLTRYASPAHVLRPYSHFQFTTNKNKTSSYKDQNKHAPSLFHSIYKPLPRVTMDLKYSHFIGLDKIFYI